MSSQDPTDTTAKATASEVTPAGTADVSVPPLASHASAVAEAPKDYDEFEIGEHKVPWFLWLFFTLIVSWASVSWIQFFGY